ncbi:hypothetical protein DEFDS_P035 (plasmid) [Deferribacter desulfuricans SSM1]|uniref:Helicase C-terminal domain-containing protein n=1 Tax=Deferribacter desulfuricans (strain DSM 14783 / JCM 11476 / NBRC 101012 / SSM1) TaxID=639282 RepID=D3PEM0_DEFDS|nr:helicase-related protein [Deferribacter desulfuricans]BAI81662.1 hypothetical protein DEFDS_P035 [Deferribacter desulfuricans SSM1]
MKIVVYENRFFVYVYDNHIFNKLMREFFEQYCIYENPNFKYMNSNLDFVTNNNKIYDGINRYYSFIKNKENKYIGFTAGIGFYKIFIKYLESNNISYELIDKRSEEYLNFYIDENTEYKFPLKTELTFRDSVKEHLKLIYRNRRGLVAAAVNYGKSYVALDLLGKAGEGTYIVAQKGLLKQFRDLVLNVFELKPRKDICYMFNSFKINWNAKIYLISSDMFYNNYKRALQTIKNKDKVSKEEYEKAKEVINYIHHVLSRKVVYFDEIHDISRQSMFELAKLCKAPYMLGVSGTLEKRGKETVTRMYCCFGYKNVLYRVKTSDLVKEGVSADTTINVIYFNNTSFTNTLYKKNPSILNNKEKLLTAYRINRNFAPERMYLRAYLKVYDDYVIFNKDLNIIALNVALNKALKEDKTTILYSNNIDHLLLLYLLLDRLNTIKLLNIMDKVTVIHGKISPVRRNSLIEGLKNDKYKIALVSDVATTGYNIPNIRCMLYLANKGSDSLVTPLQFLGRGHRITETKKYFEYYDLTAKLAYINNATRNRIKEYKKEGYKIKETFVNVTENVRIMFDDLFKYIKDNANDYINNPELNNVFGTHMQECFLHKFIKKPSPGTKTKENIVRQNNNIQFELL